MHQREQTQNSVNDGIPVMDVPKLLPTHRGKRTHIATVYRWMSRGIKGVKLPSFKVGGRRYIHSEDLYAWIEMLNKNTLESAQNLPQTSRALQQRQERARKRVEDILYDKRNKQRGRRS